jgi:glucose-1-phosphate adenylyltransferase
MAGGTQDGRDGHVLGIVQAGGKGSRMDVLTRERAKPALPFAGTYQLIDFALSAMAHSAIRDVWVSVQYLASSLDPYLAGGRPWDLDRTRGGYRRVVPQEGDGVAESGFSQGNADDLLRLRAQIEEQAPEHIVVSSADHVFATDLDRVIAQHRERGAECTVVTAEVSKKEAAHNAVVVADATGLVRRLDYKPSRPSTGVVATEVFVYETTVLLELLDRLRVELSRSGELEDGGIGDFGEHLLPRLVERGKVQAVPVGTYWRDVGRPETYLAAHRDLLAGKLDVFDVPGRPVLSRWPELPPARVVDGAEVSDSMLSPGCVIEGTVRGSVLSPGVHVRRGAVVEDSVVFRGAEVEAGAHVGTALVDRDVVVGRGARVGQPSSRRAPVPEEITMVGQDSRIGRRVEVPAGARLEPGTVA